MWKVIALDVCWVYCILGSTLETVVIMIDRFSIGIYFVLWNVSLFCVNMWIGNIFCFRFVLFACCVLRNLDLDIRWVGSINFLQVFVVAVLCQWREDFVNLIFCVCVCVCLEYIYVANISCQLVIALYPTTVFNILYSVICHHWFNSLNLK